MFWIFAALVATLSCLDGWMTSKIIRRYGAKVELNQIIRWLAKYNLTAAIALGITVPRATIIALAWVFNIPATLWFLVAFQAAYACKQLWTHRNLI